MDMELLESRLAELPLYGYFFIDPKALEFSDRIRWICEHECPMCGKTWACPPGVGSVTYCKAKCRSYESCLTVEFMRALSNRAGITLHQKSYYGANAHHITEALFKSLGVCICDAAQITGTGVTSTKGVLQG